MLYFIHHAMLFEGKLTRVRFPYQSNVYDDNVVLLDGKLTFES